MPCMRPIGPRLRIAANAPLVDALAQMDRENVGRLLVMRSDELRGMIKEAVSESGATSIKDLGKVMKIVVPQTRGVADGKLVSQLVRELLGRADEVE